MPTPTYDLIASNVLTSSASSVTFSSIPATYRDLVLVTNILGTSDSIPALRFNNDSGSNYSFVWMYGEGSAGSGSGTSATSTRIVLADRSAISPTASNRQLGISQINDYSATDKHKPVLIRADVGNGGTSALAARWANTAAINRVDIIDIAAQFASGSTFYLYGIVS